MTIDTSGIRSRHRPAAAQRQCRPGATTTLAPGSTVASYTLYDGLGQQIQTQTTSEGGSNKISDIFYDKAGRVSDVDTAPIRK